MKIIEHNEFTLTDIVALIDEGNKNPQGLGEFLDVARWYLYREGLKTMSYAFLAYIHLEKFIRYIHSIHNHVTQIYSQTG